MLLSRSLHNNFLVHTMMMMGTWKGMEMKKRERERWKRGIRSATSFKCQLWMEKFIRILMLWIMHISGKIKCLKGITQNLKCIKSISFSIIYGEEFTWAKLKLSEIYFLILWMRKISFKSSIFFVCHKLNNRKNVKFVVLKVNLINSLWKISISNAMMRIKLNN